LIKTSSGCCSTECLVIQLTVVTNVVRCYQQVSVLSSLVDKFQSHFVQHTTDKCCFRSGEKVYMETFAYSSCSQSRSTNFASPKQT